MRIPGVDPLRGVSRSGRRGTATTGGSSFSERLSRLANSDERPALTTAPVAAPTSLLGLQEVGSATDSPARRRAIAHGEAMLGVLDQLRLAILTGSLSADRLATVTRAIDVPREASGDPRLDEVLEAIHLRASVEIEKLKPRA
ncbi:MAG: hypothetical protein EA406_07015 [Rhodospirillales bacterium]|nr:MAG: hypothetical protein EA406_07015 [Rhodospirillales bacterium]